MAAKGTTKDRADKKGELFDLLSNHRRRWTVHICKQEDRSMELGELAERIAAMEQDKETAEITSSERKRVYTSLQQTHLPRLDDAGIIEFENHTVTLTEDAAELEVYMDIVPGGSIPWALYYLALAGISVVVLGIARVGWLPESISGLAVATIFVLLYGISASVHTYSNHKYRLGGNMEPP